MSIGAALAGAGLVGATKLIVGARSQWQGVPPAGQVLYYANHSSHLDTLVIWSALSPDRRAETRPVAARDYWDGGGIKTYIAREVLDVVLIDRRREDAQADPLDPVFGAIEQGSSLIIFPEGTRSPERLPGRFKGGLHKIATAYPRLPLIPVYLDTLHRSMPKGALIPLPLYCTARVGAPLERLEGEERGAFLARARDAIVSLAGDPDPDPASEPAPSPPGEEPPAR